MMETVAFGIRIKKSSNDKLENFIKLNKDFNMSRSEIIGLMIDDFIDHNKKIRFVRASREKCK